MLDPVARLNEVLATIYEALAAAGFSCVDDFNPLGGPNAQQQTVFVFEHGEHVRVVRATLQQAHGKVISFVPFLRARKQVAEVSLLAVTDAPALEPTSSRQPAGASEPSEPGPADLVLAAGFGLLAGVAVVVDGCVAFLRDDVGVPAPLALPLALFAVLFALSFGAVACVAVFNALKSD